MAVLTIGDGRAHGERRVTTAAGWAAGAGTNTTVESDSVPVLCSPGGRAGRPLTPGALLQQFRTLGIHVTQTRTAAVRQLVLQAPGPVIAQALGYSPGTATVHVTAVGGTWNRYPAARADA